VTAEFKVNSTYRAEFQPFPEGEVKRRSRR